MRRRDDEEQIDPVAEPGEQPPAVRLVRRNREAVKTEPVHQQVRNGPARRARRHVLVQLGIDDLDLVAGQRTGIARGLAQRVIVQQVLAPDVGADQGKVGPVEVQRFRQLALLRAQRALAGGRGALDVHDDRLGLLRQAFPALALGSGVDAWLDPFADAPRAPVIAEEGKRQFRQQLLATDQPSAFSRHHAGHAGKRGIYPATKGVIALPRELLPAGHGLLLAQRGARGRRLFRLAAQTQPPRQHAGLARPLCRRRSRIEDGLQVLPDQGFRRANFRLPGLHDGTAHRRHVLRHDGAGHAAEVDAKILVDLAVRHRQAAHHPDQHLVHDQPLGPEAHQVLRLEAGEISQFPRLLERREYVLATVNRRQRQERLRDLGGDAGVPRAKSPVFNGFVHGPYIRTLRHGTEQPLCAARARSTLGSSFKSRHRFRSTPSCPA